MITIDPKELKTPDIQRWLQGGIGPRPIAMVSTLSEDGIPNIGPFSFYNVFSSNPPIIAFSPARRGRDNTLKDTYNNLIATKECVVHAVTFNIVEQMNLASSEFSPDINEFEIAGFTSLESEIVKPFRIKESPFQMECKLLQMISFSENPGAGNLAICEVLKIHIDESILDNNVINPNKIDLVGRNGGEFYTRSFGSALFELPKPSHNTPIGYQNLPENIKNSLVLSANNIAKLASQKYLPTKEESEQFFQDYNTLEYNDNDFRNSLETGNYKEMMKYILNPEFNQAKREFYLHLTLKITLDKKDINFGLMLAGLIG